MSLTQILGYYCYTMLLQCNYRSTSFLFAQIAPILILIFSELNNVLQKLASLVNCSQVRTNDHGISGGELVMALPERMAWEHPYLYKLV